MTEINEDESIFGYFTYGWGLIVAFASGLIFIAFIYFGYEGRGQAALVASVAILSCIRILRPLKRKIWFWVTIGFITLAHVVAIKYYPWDGEAYTGIQLAPFMAIDIAAILLLVTLLNKLISKH